MEPLATYISRAQDQASFAEFCGGPVLLCSTRSLATDESAELTLASSPFGGNEEVSVYRVKKGGSNPFQTMITLGRSRRSDLVIRLEGVSKFHAFLVPQGHTFKLVDADSTNGTFVNGQRLSPRVGSALLVSGDRIALGDAVHLRFFTPDDLRVMLEGMPA